MILISSKVCYKRNTADRRYADTIKRVRKTNGKIGRLKARKYFYRRVRWNEDL